MVKVVRRLRRALVGTAQWAGGRPITEPALPRLALSSWTRALRSGGVRRRVLVTAFRNRTWIEWAVYAACQLRRIGVATTLVYSSAEVRRLYPLAGLPGLEHLGFWAGVEDIPDLRLVDLDEWCPTPEQTAPWREFAREFAPTVAAYDLHVEENEEGPLAPAYRREVARAETMLAETGAALTRILHVNPVSRVVCYSGLIGRSPALCEAARRAGVEVLTVEGWAWRPGHMICNRNAPALEYNVDGWLRAIGAGDDSTERETARLLRFQEGTLEEAPPGNLHRVQRTASTAPLPPAVAAFRQRPGPSFLLATNVVGDSSILRRDPIFRSQRAWVRQTVEFFRAHRGWSLVVRAHPDEAWIRGKVAVRMGEVAREVAGDAPNVLVIGGDEDVSSYALMPGLTAGLVWISSIGVDMVARGIPVLAAARPKYHGLGIVEEPPHALAYFDALRRLAKSGARPTPEQRAVARRYLNVVFREFSFDAFSPSYRARDLFLEGPGSPPDADVFYRIVAGDLPPETPPRREASRVA
ncbi:MAG TPA: hypothetical protein VLL75_18160 [Vicinamibacteria bacterium]|nr:hypothetical protein [Vicinamibacteria bacterium]